MTTLTVNLGPDSYPILIGDHLLDNAASLILEAFPGKRIMILSDDHVFPLYGAGLEKQLKTAAQCGHLTLPHGESTKNFRTLPEIYSALLDAKISRSDLIIALGGGVIGDLAGFAAATFLRGVSLIQIPTSLLAQVDSSVGGKVAVDLPQGKNLVGAFFHPKMVLIDPSVLKTLPKRYICDGMGEVIKYGCIKSASLFGRLADCPSFDMLSDELTDIITECVDIKREVVEKDPFDKGERMLLNFGHTLAHTIEQYFGYERESHGEAVAIGMYQITRMAEEQKLTRSGTAEKILHVLAQYDLPAKCGVAIRELLPAILLDKKNLDHRLNLVLLHEIGNSYLYPTASSFFQPDGQII